MASTFANLLEELNDRIEKLDLGERLEEGLENLSDRLKTLVFGRENPLGWLPFIRSRQGGLVDRFDNLQRNVQKTVQERLSNIDLDDLKKDLKNSRLARELRDLDLDKLNLSNWRYALNPRSRRNQQTRLRDIAIIGGVIGGLIALRLLAQRLPSYDMRYKTVLIMGGSRGLGLTLARQLALEGARLAITSRDAEELDRAAAELRGYGVDVLPLVCDITIEERVQDTVATVQREFGAIDVLINVSGTIIVGPLESMDMADFEASIDTHFYGPLYAMNAVIPSMRKRGNGRIVNIASIGGKVAVPHLIAYTASKFALVGLSNGFHTELHKDGISVTTVCPGLMMTGGHTNTQIKGKYREEYALFTGLASSPLIAITPEAAAAEIIRAFKRRQAEVTLSPQAQILARLAGLFPNLVIGFNTWGAGLLPKYNGAGDYPVKGKNVDPSLIPENLRTIADEAVATHNGTEPASRL